MSIKEQIKNTLGQVMSQYKDSTAELRAEVSQLAFKDEYQNRIIHCMVGEVDDNYIETPETDSPMVKLENSKEGLVKVPTVKGKTILVDAEGNETDTPGEGCRLVSVGEEDNKLIILSKNEDLALQHKSEILLSEPLRSLPNGICDERVGNKLIRRVGRFVFNGSENWYLPTSYNLQSAKGYVAFCSDVLYGKVPNNAGFKCNIFTYKSYDGGFRQTLDFEGISDGGGYYITFVRIKEDKLQTNDLNGFRQYLKENPMEVLYVLKEPIIEELPNAITLQGFDDTTMYIENSIVPTVSYGYNALIPFKEELRKQQTQTVFNQNDLDEFISPYLEDIEIQLENL